MRQTGSTAAALVAATLVAGTAVTALGASTPSNAAIDRDAFTRQVSDDAPTCNGAPAVTGIGHDAAAKIWYRALTVHMTSSTDYHGARTASLNAARDLYGAGSTQYNAVNAAWAGVNVS
jgi:thermolysin metallopeptidase-like protein